MQLPTVTIKDEAVMKSLRTLYTLTIAHRYDYLRENVTVNDEALAPWHAEVQEALCLGYLVGRLNLAHLVSPHQVIHQLGLVEVAEANLAHAYWPVELEAPAATVPLAQVAAAG